MSELDEVGEEAVTSGVSGVGLFICIERGASEDPCQLYLTIQYPSSFLTSPLLWAHPS